MSARTRGICEALGSGVAFGFLGFFGKSAYQSGILPFELLSLRFLVAGVVLFALSLGFRGSIPKITRSQLVKCVVLGVLGYAVFSGAFFWALQGLSASVTVLLLYLYPIPVALLGHFLLKEHLNLWQWTAIPMALLGLFLLVCQSLEISKPEFLVFGLLSAAIYALYILSSRVWLREEDPYLSTSLIQLSAGSVLALVAMRSPIRALEILESSWVLILSVSLISTVIAMGLFIASLQKLKAMEVSLLSLTEPVTGLAVGALLLGETPSWLQALGGLLILVSLAVISTGESKHRP